MKSRLVTYSAGIVVLAVGLGLWLSAPVRPSQEEIAALAAAPSDIDRGAWVFTVSGCASCHAAKDAKDEARLILSGGQAFPSDFGTFYGPNISPDREVGIGAWSRGDLLGALRHGTSPAGSHLYPALPFTAYTHMSVEDVAALHSYMMTLPASSVPSRDHDVGFPFSVRRGLGLWKLIYHRTDYVVETSDPQQQLGRYIVEGLAHCGECHTPRDGLGGLDRSRWLEGAPNPSGRGTIPALTPDKLTWSDEDIYFYLTSGLTPEFDTAGDQMVEVIDNIKTLPESDVRAIIAYLRGL